jgi:hypothetical protein
MWGVVEARLSERAVLQRTEVSWGRETLRAEHLRGDRHGSFVAALALITLR